MASLQCQNDSLVTNLEYYKKKMLELEVKKIESLSLEEAVIKSVNGLLDTKQWYKVMNRNSKANAIARAVFNHNFANEVAFEAIRSGFGQMSSLQNRY
jgi:hypothetical protein